MNLYVRAIRTMGQLSRRKSLESKWPRINWNYRCNCC